MEGVAGFITTQELKLEEYLQTASDDVRKLSAGFRALRWGPEEVQMFMATARRAGSSVARTSAGAVLMQELEEAKKASGVGVDYDELRKSGHHVTQIRVDLTEEQKQFMRDDLSGITNVQFVSSGSGDRVKHPVPAAFKVVMAVQLFRQIPREAVVLEPGGDIMAAIRRGVERGKYFTCRPMLDRKDLQRYATEMRAAQVMVKRSGRCALKPSQKTAAELFVREPEAVVIKDKVQNVTVGAEYVVSLHSNWDTPVEQVPATMRRCGARVWYIVMNRVRGLDFYSGKRTGVDRDMGIEWHADADRDEVVFTFDGDSSLPYKHRLSVVRGYQHMHVKEYVCGGRLYAFTEAEFSTRSQLVLMCVDFGLKQVPRTFGFDCYATGGHGMVQVTAPVLVTDVAARSEKRYVDGVFTVGEDVLCRVLQERIIAGDKGSPETVLAYARNNRFSVLHNGVRVSVSHPIAVEQFRQFAVAVDALACDIQRSANVDVAAVAAQLAGGGYVYRSVGAWIGSVVGSVTEGAALYDSVVRRIQQLFEDNTVGKVKVERLSGVKTVARAPRLTVRDDGVRCEPRCKCYCLEKREVQEMLSGERGGLSAKEEKALEQYLVVLSSRKCVQCETVEDVVARIAEEAEEFFDCDTGESESTVGTSCVGSSSDGECASTPATELSQENRYDGIKEEVDEEVYQQTCASELEVLAELERYVGVSDIEETGRKTRMRKAAEEYVYVLGKQMRAVESDIREKVLVASMTGRVDQASLNSVSDERCWYSVVEVAPGGTVVRALHDRAKVGEFQRVYDFKAQKFYTVRVTRHGSFLPPEASSVVCTSTKLQVWNQPLLIERSLSLLRSGGFLDGPEVRMPFVNGVPGCGKTYGVMESYKREAKPGQRLILTATRSSAEEIREKLFNNSSAGRIYVRTYDSVTMHGVNQWFEEVAWDELAALSMGQFCLLMAYLQPRKARGYGDFYQMEYKPFCDHDMEFPTVAPLCTTVFMPVSHRCRVSVMAAAVPLYPSEAKLAVCTCHPHVLETEEGGPELLEVSSIAQVPMRSGVKYLTAGQGDKNIVREALKASGVVSRAEAAAAVSTYAESQGITVKEVICVRTEARTKPGSIFHEKKRTNVGRSRATHLTTYCTVASEVDAMRQSCVDARNEFFRRQVRENSVRFAEEAEKVGGLVKCFEHCFTMELVEYVY